MRDRLKGKSVVITKERARSIRPILLWVKEISTRQKVKLQAISILREIEGIEDYKQVILTRGEADLLAFIFSEFPDGVDPEGKQLSLFGQPSEPTVTLKEIPRRVAEEKPTLKTKLTKEEQVERDETIGKLGYEPKPTSYFEDILMGKREPEEQE